MREREEKQRKYEERRQELFGTSSKPNPSGANNGNSGSSTPRNTTPTPPGSRSATPSRNRGRGGRRGGGATQPPKDMQQKREKELYDPSYTPKPDAAHLQRREKDAPESTEAEIQPIRSPRGPDGSGRRGFGFVTRGGKATSESAAPKMETGRLNASSP